jgi:peptidoglycan/LPS O-acetylase OafA/YrhL
VGGHRLFYWGIPSFLIVWGALSLEHRGVSFKGVLSSLGDSSYSLYLSHIFVLFLVGKVWAWAGFSGYLGNVTLMVVGYGACLLVGMLSFKLVEQSSLNYLSEKLVKNKNISSQKGVVESVKV